MSLNIYKYLILFLVFQGAHGQISQAGIDSLVEYHQLEKAKHILLQKNNLSASEKLYLGDIASHLKEWDLAINSYTSLVDDDPSNAVYNFKLGGAMGMKAMRMNKLKAAFLIPNVKMYLEKATMLDPDHVESHRALVELYLQLPGVLGGSIEKAKKHTKQLKELSILDYYIALATLSSFKEEEENSKQAILNGLKYLKAKPGLVSRNYIYYEYAEWLTRYSVGREEVENLMNFYTDGSNYLDLKTPSEAYFRLAQLSKRINEKEHAIFYINKSLSYNVNSKKSLSLKNDIQDM